MPQLDAIADTVGHDLIGKLLPKLKRGGILGSVLGKPKAAEDKDIRVDPCWPIRMRNSFEGWLRPLRGEH